MTMSADTAVTHFNLIPPFLIILVKNGIDCINEYMGLVVELFIVVPLFVVR